jgi:hypothetical protein
MHRPVLQVQHTDVHSKYSAPDSSQTRLGRLKSNCSYICSAIRKRRASRSQALQSPERAIANPARTDYIYQHANLNHHTDFSSPIHSRR